MVGTISRKCILGLAVALLLFTGSSIARADTMYTYTYTLNTSALAGLSGDVLAFQMTGTGNGTVTDTVTLSNFFFGTGSAGAIVGALGGASGNANGTVTLTDSAFFSLFEQQFTAGSVLSFTVSSTEKPNGTNTPDLFAFVILDANGNPVFLTGDPSGANSLFTITIDSGGATGTNYAPVPEPATLALMGSALLVCAGLVRKKWGVLVH